ncbi:MAG: ATP-binding cassette domain-containing protein, partial [Verrucomicrobiales bacterium]
GSATVAGCDIFRDSLELRRRIGYLPENVPLYTDMRVKEYLHFRAALRGLGGRKARVRVGEVMEVCALQEVRKKIIGTLSKGYRQRVGLADALVHKPELLILDEPTNGLDPNQIRQVRDLIKQLGEEHTILLSTHMLPEVEVTCGRVIIIDNGIIKAADTPQNLVRRLRAAGTVTVEVRTTDEKSSKGPGASSVDKIGARLRRIPGVKKLVSQVARGDWTVFTLRVEAHTDIREEIFSVALNERWILRELTRKNPSLEDVFVDLTHPVTKA